VYVGEKLDLPSLQQSISKLDCLKDAIAQEGAYMTYDADWSTTFNKVAQSEAQPEPLLV